MNKTLSDMLCGIHKEVHRLSLPSTYSKSSWGVYNVSIAAVKKEKNATKMGGLKQHRFIVSQF